MPSSKPSLQERMIAGAQFHGVRITFSEDEKYVTVSVQIPQTIAECNRNYRFWQWFFDTTKRNFGAAAFLYSCEFLSDWKPQAAIPLSRRKRLLKFFGFRISENIMPATGNPIETVVGFTVSVYKGIVLQLSKTEFDKLKSLGLTCVEEVRGDTFPYQLRLGENVLSVKLKK